MDMSLFTSFEGRIGRKSWWLGTILLIVVVLILWVILGPLMGASMMSGFDASAGADAMLAMVRKFGIVSAVITAIIAYPAIALMKKRLNDRDRPSWMIYVFWAPTVLNILLNLIGAGYTMAETNGVQMPAPTSIGWLVSMLSLVVGIWALVELGFLKGTDGPNQHGPDPAAA
jgi:uncharacterized membrane protein YhaH (DUF805 family)